MRIPRYPKSLVSRCQNQAQGKRLQSEASADCLDAHAGNAYTVGCHDGSALGQFGSGRARDPVAGELMSLVIFSLWISLKFFKFCFSLGNALCTGVAESFKLVRASQTLKGWWALVFTLRPIVSCFWNSQKCSTDSLFTRKRYVWGRFSAHGRDMPRLTGVCLIFGSRLCPTKLQHVHLCTSYKMFSNEHSIVVSAPRAVDVYSYPELTLNIQFNCNIFVGNCRQLHLLLLTSVILDAWTLNEFLKLASYTLDIPRWEPPQAFSFVIV